jgi:transaldolase
MVIYLDGADLATMGRYGDRVEGFTTNPSLCRKAGVKDYKEFCKAVLAFERNKPVSFEVLADDLPGMELQAITLSGFGSNVYVKIPVVNSEGESTAPVIKSLADSGVKVNVTVVFTEQQIKTASEALGESDSIISIFAGRIADAGVNPIHLFNMGRYYRKSFNTKILWASVREVYNVKQAKEAFADIITLPAEFIEKLSGFGRDLTEYSRETVQQFKRDAEGITL